MCRVVQSVIRNKVLWSAENILGATLEVVETRILTMKRRLTFSIKEGSANIEEWGQICSSGISDMKGSGLADVQNGETSRQERTEDKHEAEDQPTREQYS